jgi:TonB-dependent SusC/RagA subfamily outer membrane receptor
VEANGTNYIKIVTEAVQAPDKVSKRLDSLVISMITRTSYSQQDQKDNLQAIKETYNQTYNLVQPVSPSNFNYLVRGRITERESGRGIPGVSLVVKGSTTGTVTDANGEYSLYTPPNGVLIFSFIGYVTEERLIGSRSYIDVSLDPDIQSLSEVVVVGYGTQKRSDVTAAISTVLQGRAAGVYIRGTGSVSANQQPLLIVDGVPFTGSQADLDPDLITAMEVLKEDAATAIYGSRGANGVILITTKKKKNLSQNQSLATEG